MDWDNCLRVLLLVPVKVKGSFQNLNFPKNNFLFRVGRTDGRADGRTGGRTVGRTVGRTDGSGGRSDVILT